MKCTQFDMTSYREKIYNKKTMQAIELHLSQCRECRQRMEAEDSLLHALVASFIDTRKFCLSRELLKKYISGTLSLENKLACERHLGHCTDCSKTLQMMLQSENVLTTNMEGAADPSLTDKAGAEKAIYAGLRKLKRLLHEHEGKKVSFSRGFAGEFACFLSNELKSKQNSMPDIISFVEKPIMDYKNSFLNNWESIDTIKFCPSPKTITPNEGKHITKKSASFEKGVTEESSKNLFSESREGTVLKYILNPLVTKKY